MQAAFEAGGGVVGVLADSLRKEALSRKYREMIATGRVALASPFGPDSRFSVGNAMGRNRLIDALSDAVVIADSAESGGTWSGGLENFKVLRVPTYVRTGPAEAPGNAPLRAAGGISLTLQELEASWDGRFPATAAEQSQQLDLFAPKP